MNKNSLVAKLVLLIATLFILVVVVVVVIIINGRQRIQGQTYKFMSEYTKQYVLVREIGYDSPYKQTACGDTDK